MSDVVDLIDQDELLNDQDNILSDCDTSSNTASLGSRVSGKTYFIFKLEGQSHQN